MPFVLYQDQATPIKNIYCIGHNYAAHITELNHQRDDEVLVFLKPNSALLRANNIIHLPEYSHDIHYECELIVLIGQDADNIQEDEALNYIQGYGIGLDITARDIQNKLKSKGLPWLKAKGFKHSACVSNFIAADTIHDVTQVEFFLRINGELRQHGLTKNMIYSIPYLIAYLSKIYSLQAGDLIYTGTPEGVGTLYPDDQLQLELDNKISCQFSVS